MARKPNARIEQALQSTGPISLVPVSLRDVFDWAETDAYKKLQPDHFKREIDSLREYFEFYDVEHLNDEVVEGFRNELQSLAKKAGKKAWADPYVETYVLRLNALIVAYGAAHKVNLPILFTKNDPVTNKIYRVLTREEVKRLLYAAGGKKWDASVERMVCLDSKAQRRERKRRCAGAARYILLATLVGVSRSCALELVWGPSETPDESFVDLTAGTITRRGRSTPKFPKFAEASFRIPRWLLRLMRVWHEADKARGIRHVVHLPSGEARTDDLAQLLRSLTKSAGIEPFKPRTLFDTFVATALERGAPVYGTAIAAGMDPTVLRERYGHFRFDVQNRSMQAMDRFLTSDAVAPKKPARGVEGGAAR